MLTDPEAWFLTSKALDHHGTVAALRQALPGDAEDLTEVAQQMAVTLARSGFVLVGIDASATTDTPVNDLTDQLESFLNRKED